jgi:hypothetical protein
MIFSASANGSAPQSKVYRMVPHDQTSALQPSYGSPDETSGAMYLPAPT